MLELEQVLDEIPQLAEPERTVSAAPGRPDQRQLQGRHAGRRYHVRRWSDDTGLLAIDRDNEYQNSVRAAEVGVGAGVLAYLPEHNTMVMEWIEGPTLSAERLRRGGAPRRGRRGLPAAARRARASATTSTCSRSSRDTCEIVRSAAFACRSATSEFEPHVAAIREAFAVRDEGTVPCNNDLLAENFMLTARRSAADRLRVLGQQRPVLRARQHLERVEPLARAARAAGRRLLRPPGAPQGRARAPVGPDVEVRLDAVGLDPGRRLAIDFDFWSWGMEKYERAVAEFESPEFERLLDEARRSD